MLALLCVTCPLGQRTGGNLLTAVATGAGADALIAGEPGATEGEEEAAGGKGEANAETDEVDEEDKGSSDSGREKTGEADGKDRSKAGEEAWSKVAPKVCSYNL